ncbi:poly(hydroxyalkanoate) depolymerase family esterase [Janthinobacterium sp. CG_23.3]|uniref:extracellular catalytic domain type 1 short-chain-length polyhydroxyalkanoate depolymerase n=1 Tax=Janthinobacterium sp. CG_23.3 TaxID=3349634 RepID=UPI0038D3930C
MKFTNKLLTQMREASKKMFGKGGAAAATETIQQALAGLQAQAQAQSQAQAQAQAQARPMHDINPPPPGASAKAAPQPQAQGAEAPPRPAQTPQQMAQEFAQDFMSRLGVPNGAGKPGFEMPAFDLNSFELPGGMKMPGAGMGASAPAELAPGAQFISGTFRNHAGSRDYKLYIPSSFKGQPMPLVVMLHGCTQNPDDFANGTQMNAVAEEKQCFVVYPAQAKSANNSRCWNWFNALDQQRGQGEPSIIAGIAQQIIDSQPVDRRQVYVAGLSAGGAMAVIVGALYPELFAAVGVHSGLPFASAQDLPSALAAMKGGSGGSRKAPEGGVPIIVFHGDRDTTVNPRNGEEVMAQGLRSQSRGAAAASVDSGSVPNGHRYTRTTHRHVDGTPLGEHWVIHGAGHAWSGGSDSGTYTDRKGPDASREMMRFFETVSP